MSKESILAELRAELERSKKSLESAVNFSGMNSHFQLRAEHHGREVERLREIIFLIEED